MSRVSADEPLHRPTEKRFGGGSFGIRLAGAFVGAACGITPFIVLALLGQDSPFARGYASLGIPFSALGGAGAGGWFALHPRWPQAIDWWQAGRIALAGWLSGMGSAVIWAFAYADGDIVARIGLATLVLLGALPSVSAAFVAALAYLPLMRLVSRLAGRVGRP